MNVRQFIMSKCLTVVSIASERNLARCVVSIDDSAFLLNWFVLFVQKICKIVENLGNTYQFRPIKRISIDFLSFAEHLSPSLNFHFECQVWTSPHVCLPVFLKIFFYMLLYQPQDLLWNVNICSRIKTKQFIYLDKMFYSFFSSSEFLCLWCTHWTISLSQQFQLQFSHWWCIYIFVIPVLFNFISYFEYE